MLIGLLDCDSHNFPSLPLMKISAFYKLKGDDVEFILQDSIKKYDCIYVSKVFGDEYSKMPVSPYMLKQMSDHVFYGGTGFAISIKNGREYYDRSLDLPLPYDIEHIYPDYSLYSHLTKNTAFGFLSRGCPNCCSFCLVSKKEGICSYKVADLCEFYDGQKNIKLLDPNLLACNKRLDLLSQLKSSDAFVDFTQGLDARFITKDIAYVLRDIKKASVHFAFDFMRNKDDILNGLKLYADICGLPDNLSMRSVYVLTNYNTTHEEDMLRVSWLQNLGFAPYIMVYRKSTAPLITRQLQRWCNNRILYKSCTFKDFIGDNHEYSF